MDTQKEKAPSTKKAATKLRQMAIKKVDLETAKTILSIKERINKKQFGRKIKDAEIISLAIRQVNNDHIRELQEVTYSENDRLLMAHDEYQKVNGKITMDQFIGKLLKGELKIQ
jgi:hypothetical protein